MTPLSPSWRGFSIKSRIRVRRADRVQATRRLSSRRFASSRSPRYRCGPHATRSRYSEGFKRCRGGVPVPSNRLYFTPQPSRQYRNGGGGLRSSPFARSAPPPVPDPPRSTLGPMDPMPQAGDLIEAFSPQPGRRFRMVQLVQLQATHCYGPPAWRGIWRDRAGRS
jgi:hypothetical protein